MFYFFWIYFDDEGWDRGLGGVKVSPSARSGGWVGGGEGSGGRNWSQEKRKQNEWVIGLSDGDTPPHYTPTQEENAFFSELINTAWIMLYRQA